MAEDFGEKTEAATPRRRQEAREQGNIARSADLTGATVIVGMMLLLNWQGPALVRTLKGLIVEMLGESEMNSAGGTEAAHSMVPALIGVGKAMAPLLLGVMLIAVVVNVAQVG